MGQLLLALAEAGGACSGKEGSKKFEPFTWPLEELDEAGISPALRERMGLTEEALTALVERGEFDEALVEAFAVATNTEEAAVRAAFEQRKPAAEV
jgi:hypothetical protein